MSTTIVTMFFNLTTLPDATPAVRPQSFYMEKGRATLALPYPMVVFCDETTIDEIKRIRGDQPTQYIVKPIYEYDLYKHNYATIRKNREGVANYIGSRNTSSYFLLCMFKSLALLISKQQNTFDTTHFAWIDFGGSHVMRNFDQGARRMVENPNPKVSFCYIDYRSADDLCVIDSRLTREGWCGAACTSYTVEGAYMDRFYNGTMAIFHEMLAKGVGHNDEQVMTYFFNRYPELCSIYYGDYFSILSNYKYPCEDYNTIRWCFLNKVQCAGRYDLARACIAALFKSVADGHLAMSDDEYKTLDTMSLLFRNEYGHEINHLYTERTEQLQAERYIPANAVVLELGARYGTVWCVINRRQSNKLNQVSVEPDARVWDALERNRYCNSCSFHIVKGVVSKKKLALNTNVPDGYCTQTKASEDSSLTCLTLDEVQEKYNLCFDTLVADCEGFLESFMDENPVLYTQLVRILFEKDCPDRCNYDKIKEQLVLHGFKCLVDETHEVWQK